MARHWTQYTRPALTDKQIRALDAMAREHGLGDGLDALAKASGLSRSRAGKDAADRHGVRVLVDAAFRVYGRNGTGQAPPQAPEDAPAPQQIGQAPRALSTPEMVADEVSGLVVAAVGISDTASQRILTDYDRETLTSIRARLLAEVARIHDLLANGTPVERELLALAEMLPGEVA